MTTSNETPDHMRWMGTLVVNLQSLEFAIRAFLYSSERGEKDQGKPKFLDNIEEGQELDENAFTNYDTLDKLIKKYNDGVDANLQVDRRIARLRDALAHGRIAGLSPSGDEPLRLVKYDKPTREHVVRVTDYYILTQEWFDKNIKWVYESLKKVQQANESFAHL